jgi:hypothetical protein
MEKWSFQRTRELMTPRALRGMAVNEVGRARISMMVQSMGSNSRPDTLVQDRTPQPHRFLLQRTAGPYIGVKRFQTIHCYSVDVARGLVLLFGIGTILHGGQRPRRAAHVRSAEFKSEAQRPS